METGAVVTQTNPVLTEGKQ